MSKEHIVPISALAAPIRGTSPALEREYLQPQRLKIISMGNLGAGKSCMIKRFCEEKFVSKYISTIGIDYGVKSLIISDREVRVNFWDFSGQDEFLHVRNEFYKDAQGALLVYDVTSRPSFEALNHWIEEAVKFGIERYSCIVCANKIDKMHRVVTEDEGKVFARSKGWEYFETSACTGVNINSAFTKLFQQVLNSD